MKASTIVLNSSRYLFPARVYRFQFWFEFLVYARAKPSHAMPCHAMPCRAVPHHATRRYIVFSTTTIYVHLYGFPNEISIAHGSICHSGVDEGVVTPKTPASAAGIGRIGQIPKFDQHPIKQKLHPFSSPLSSGFYFGESEDGFSRSWTTHGLSPGNVSFEVLQAKPPPQPNLNHTTHNMNDHHPPHQSSILPPLRPGSCRFCMNSDTLGRHLDRLLGFLDKEVDERSETFRNHPVEYLMRMRYTTKRLRFVIPCVNLSPPHDLLVANL